MLVSVICKCYYYYYYYQSGTDTGIIMTFITTPLNIYMVEVLNAEPQDALIMNP